MKLKAYYIILLCCSFFSAELSAQNAAQNAIQKFESDPQLAGSSIGFCAIDAQNGKTIAASQNQLNLAPASVQKLITTAAALDMLGTDYQFTTAFYVDTIYSSSKATLRLTIKAGGDPTIGSKYFFGNAANQLMGAWAKAILKQSQTKQFDEIIVDLSAYDTQYLPNTWIWEDIGNYYGTGIYALSLFDNTCTLHFNSPSKADKPTTITHISPKSAKINIDNQVLSSNIEQDKAFAFGSPLDSHRVIRGTIPKDRSNFSVKIALPSPPLTLAEELASQLQAQGAQVKKIKLSYAPVATKNLVFAHHSPKLSQIVNITNHESVNLFAEHLVKQLAYEKYGQGNFNQGLQLIKDYWKKQGIDFAFLEDGSGLSRFNTIRAEQLTEALYKCAQNPQIANAFFGSLPIAPKGTLWYFNKKTFPNNCLRAKSGSMTRIRSFAGELKTDSGKTVLFTIIVNNFPVSQSEIIKKIQKLLSEIKENY